MPPASSDPATREALMAHQAGGLRWLLGGGIAVVLGVLLGGAVVAIVGSTGRGFPGAGLVVVVLGFAGTVAAVAGVGALLRTHRWARALARTSWQIGRLRIAGPAIIAFEPAGHGAPSPRH